MWVECGLRHIRRLPYRASEAASKEWLDVEGGNGAGMTALARVAALDSLTRRPECGRQKEGHDPDNIEKEEPMTMVVEKRRVPREPTAPGGTPVELPLPPGPHEPDP